MNHRIVERKLRLVSPLPSDGARSAEGRVVLVENCDLHWSMLGATGTAMLSDPLGPRMRTCSVQYGERVFFDACLSDQSGARKVYRAFCLVVHEGGC